MALSVRSVREVLLVMVGDTEWVVRNLVIKIRLVGLIAEVVCSLLVWRKESMFLLLSVIACLESILYNLYGWKWK